MRKQALTISFLKPFKERGLYKAPKVSNSVNKILLKPNQLS